MSQHMFDEIGAHSNKLGKDWLASEISYNPPFAAWLCEHLLLTEGCCSEFSGQILRKTLPSARGQNKFGWRVTSMRVAGYAQNEVAFPGNLFVQCCVRGEIGTWMLLPTFP